MLGFFPGKGNCAKATRGEVLLTVCSAARQHINNKHSVCGVWECGPSLCGAAWHMATGRSR